MANPFGYQNGLDLDPGIVTCDGYFAIDGSSAIVNTNTPSTATIGQDGRPLVLPKWCSAAAKDGSTAGLYHFTLKENWVALQGISVTLCSSSIKSGTLQVLGFNVLGANVTGPATTAQTIDVQYQQGGSASALTQCGISLILRLRNINTP